MKVTDCRKVFSTPWFDVVAKKVEPADAGGEFYSLEMPDYVSVVALTEENEVVLVEQFRPAVEDDVLELPSGHVDEGESPEVSAARELFEETGFKADKLELLGRWYPDTGRHSNRMWCYLAKDVRRDSGWNQTESGVNPKIVTQNEFLELLVNQKFNHALNLAAVGMAQIKYGIFR